jgi:gamma-glutamylcyclotransferase (GGCT)/AIG2-like uncharacterized protein YtfP
MYKYVETPVLTLFVYGTLKQGGENFATYCSDAVGIKKARVPGRLWVLPAGFPMLEVPRGLSLAEGTQEYSTDASLSGPFTSKIWPPRIDEPFGWVEGEVMSFLDPVGVLRMMDDLEGFNPGRPSLYARRLLAVESEDGIWMAAWAYTAPNSPESDWSLHPRNSWP